MKLNNCFFDSYILHVYADTGPHAAMVKHHKQSIASLLPFSMP